jgi:hypothetical protein
MEKLSLAKLKEKRLYYDEKVKFFYKYLTLVNILMQTF